MPAFFDNKVIFPKSADPVTISITVDAQPSVTSIYLGSDRLIQFEGDKANYDVGDGAALKGKKIRIHTSVQDKNDNTDDIRVLHEIKYGSKKAERSVNTTASDDGDIFDIYTDLRVF